MAWLFGFVALIYFFRHAMAECELRESESQRDYWIRAYRGERKRRLDDAARYFSKRF